MKYFIKRATCFALTVFALSVLGGCGGYARQSTNGTSGVEVYGTVDAGVYHGNR